MAIVDNLRGEVQLRSAADSSLIRTIGVGGVALAFSPDGRTLATGGGGTLGLWDPATGDCIRTPANVCRTKDLSPATFVALAFSPDGQQLAGGGGSSPALGIFSCGTSPTTRLGTLADTRTSYRSSRSRRMGACSLRQDGTHASLLAPR